MPNLPVAAALTRYKQTIKKMAQVCRNIEESVVNGWFQLGGYVVEIMQDGEIRSHYGDNLLLQVSDDLTKECGRGFSVDNIERARKFYLTYKNSAAPRKLTWSHYSELLSVDNKQKRDRLEEAAKRQKMTTRELREKVNEIKAKERKESQKPVKLPPLKRITEFKYYTYKKADPEDAELIDLLHGPDKDRSRVDCGFYVTLPVVKNTDGIVLTEKPSYTYHAVVERVVDGDTLKVVISLTADVVVREYLRLRGVNAPEAKTPEGAKAKRCLGKLLPRGTLITIRTYRSDLHGRFVVDVYYREGDELKFLNQELLDLGLAERVAE